MEGNETTLKRKASSSGNGTSGKKRGNTYSNRAKRAKNQNSQQQDDGHSTRHDDGKMPFESKQSLPHARTKHSQEAQQHENSNKDPYCSIEALLAVPLSLIFRQVPTTSQKAHRQQQSIKPLLTLAEARCFLNINMLSQEMDVLIDVASEALFNQRWCRQFATQVVPLVNQPSPFVLLRSILPILAAHAHINSNALSRIQTDMDRVLYEIQACRVALRQYSEQNWTLSDSLLDAIGIQQQETSDTHSFSGGFMIAKEKRILSDIQEELCNRMEHMMELSSISFSTNPKDPTTTETEKNPMPESSTENPSTMEDYCRQKLTLDKTDKHALTTSNVAASPPAAPMARAVTASPQRADPNDKTADDEEALRNNTNNTTSSSTTMLSLQHYQQETAGSFSYPSTIHQNSQSQQRHNSQHRPSMESSPLLVLDEGPNNQKETWGHERTTDRPANRMIGTTQNTLQASEALASLAFNP